MDDFKGSVQILSNIQSQMVYFQLSQIHSLAAKRLAEFSESFFRIVLQRRSAAPQPEIQKPLTTLPSKSIDARQF